MGNTVEQYRAAIGGFNSGSPSLSNANHCPEDIGLHDGSPPGAAEDNATNVTKGPWKIHAMTLVCLYITLAAPLMC